MALFFGLIHGLGFSNTFRALLFPDEQQQLLTQLLAFNIGIEVGQLGIVALILLLAYLAQELGRVSLLHWNGALSGLVLLLGVGLLLRGLWSF